MPRTRHGGQSEWAKRRPLSLLIEVARSLTIVDRGKELIKYKGLQVAAAAPHGAHSSQTSASPWPGKALELPTAKATLL